MRTLVKSFFTRVLVGLVVLGGAAHAGAQSRRSGVPATFLLASKAVQDELKLSAEQAQKAQEAFEKDRQSREAIESASADEGDKRWPELLAESEKTVAAILSQTQLKRFKQIRLQQSGALSLADPKLAAELKLTEDQRKAVKKVVEDRAAKVKAAIADSTLPKREIAAKLTEYTKAADEEIRKHLSAEQAAKWQEMIGEPFHWPMP